MLVRSGKPDAVARALVGVDGVRSTIAPADWRHDGTAVLTVIPTADANSPAGRATLDRIRAATHASPGQVTVGGKAAQSADFLHAVYSNFPLVIALIAVLTFLLLARAFRSLVLPLKAVVLNLISVAAAWGLLVLVWQHGFGWHAIWGIEATQSINVEMPIVVFAFLFGVSMDYQVFIISRMREAYDRTGSTETAVVEGIGRTGRLVTSAAMIMALAFVAMSASPGTEVKMFATALGGGILLDATIVRGVLAPALVAILGRWNWWLPRRSARMLRVEPSLAQPEGFARPRRVWRGARTMKRWVWRPRNGQTLGTPTATWRSRTRSHIAQTGRACCPSRCPATLVASWTSGPSTVACSDFSMAIVRRRLVSASTSASSALMTLIATGSGSRWPSSWASSPPSRDKPRMAVPRLAGGQPRSCATPGSRSSRGATPPSSMTPNAAAR